MAIEIESFHMKNGDVPYSYLSLPEGKRNWFETGVHDVFLVDETSWY